MSELAITQAFIQNLFNHTVFQQQLQKRIAKSNLQQRLAIQQEMKLNNNAISIQQINQEISQTLIQVALSTTLCDFQGIIASITKDIATVKLNIQSLQTKILKPKKDPSQQPQELLGQISMNNLQNSSIQYNFLKRNLQELQQRINQINFGNSFSLELLNKQDQEELSERINKSVGDTVFKLENTVQTRINRIQKDLNRRIDHILKTIRSLFDMINDMDLSAHQKIKKPTNKLSNLFGFGQ